MGLEPTTSSLGNCPSIENTKFSVYGVDADDPKLLIQRGPIPEVCYWTPNGLHFSELNLVVAFEPGRITAHRTASAERFAQIVRRQSECWNRESLPREWLPRLAVIDKVCDVGGEVRVKSGLIAQFIRIRLGQRDAPEMVRRAGSTARDTAEGHSSCSITNSAP